MADSHSTHSAGGHEHRDVTFRPIVLSAIGLVVLTVLVFVGMRLLFNVYAAREAELSPRRNPLAISYGREFPPEPRLQTAPIQDLQKLHAWENDTLSTYGWADEKTGAVRIPIARAMELLLQRGVPTRSEPSAAAGASK
ncbi:MAG TPA: hypothetical protein VMW17_00660 [Candidatus Binatia bacterium]|nr:hypothetical protein [Candidatus Binatia bacterium]